MGVSKKKGVQRGFLIVSRVLITWARVATVAPAACSVAPVQSIVHSGASVVGDTFHICSLSQTVFFSPLYSKGNLHSSPPAVPPVVEQAGTHCPSLPIGTYVPSHLSVQQLSESAKNGPSQFFIPHFRLSWHSSGLPQPPFKIVMKVLLQLMSKKMKVIQY